MDTRRIIEFSMQKKFFTDTFIDPKNPVIQEKFIVSNTPPITLKNEEM